MPTPPPGGDCIATQEAVLIVRIALDRNAQLCRGELLDSEAKRQAGFVNWDGLKQAVEHWLKNRQKTLDGKERRTI